MSRLREWLLGFADGVAEAFDALSLGYDLSDSDTVLPVQPPW